MWRLRRRFCAALGTLLIVLGLVVLLGSCAQQPRRAPPVIPAPAGPSKVAPPVAKHSVQSNGLRYAKSETTVPLPSARLAISTAMSAPPPPRSAAAPVVPIKAYRYAPLLARKQLALWPDAPEAHTLGGLVEQESCVSLKSARCWDPHAELKTKREYGFGLGQLTVAYNADGSERFNKFDELRRAHASLAAWRWEDRYDPGYQLTAIVEMVHGIWGRVPPADGAETQWAFTLNSYNGGLGGLLQDRRLCVSTPGCNPRLWFGNIETHSLKSRAAQPGYGGQDWYHLTRGYVRKVLLERRGKYAQFWGP